MDEDVVQVIRRRAPQGTRILDLAKSERQHFYTDLWLNAHASSKNPFPRQKFGALLSEWLAVEAAAAAPPPPAAVPEFAASFALSYPAVCGVVGENGVATSFTRPAGDSNHGSATALPDSGRILQGRSEQRLPPGRAVQLVSLTVDGALLQRPWQQNDAARFSSKGLLPPRRAAAARVPGGFTAADTTALFPPPVLPTAEADQKHFPAAARLVRAAADAQDSPARVALAISLQNAMIMQLVHGLPQHTPAPPQPVAKDDAAPVRRKRGGAESTLVEDVAPLIEIADWRAILLAYTPVEGSAVADAAAAGEVATDQQIYGLAFNDPAAAFLIETARVFGPADEKFTQAVAVLARARSQIRAAVIADTQARRERLAVVQMLRVLKRRNPSLRAKRPELILAPDRKVLAQMLGAAYGPLAKDYLAEQQYWQARIDNKCAHVAAYRQLRRDRRTDRRGRALQKLLQFMEPGFAKVKDRWVSCRACEFPVICPHVLVALRAEIEDRPAAATEEALRHFATRDAAGPPACQVCGELLPQLELDEPANLDDRFAGLADETEEMVRIELRNAAGNVRSELGQVNPRSIIEAGLPVVSALYNRARGVINRDRTVDDETRERSAKAALGLYVYAFLVSVVVGAGPSAHLAGEPETRGGEKTRQLAVLTAGLRLFVSRYATGLAADRDAATIKKRFLEAYAAVGRLNLPIHTTTSEDMFRSRLLNYPPLNVLRLARWHELHGRAVKQKPNESGRPPCAYDLDLATVLGHPLSAFLPRGNRKPEQQLFADVPLPPSLKPFTGPENSSTARAYVWRITTTPVAALDPVDGDRTVPPYLFPLADCPTRLWDLTGPAAGKNMLPHNLRPLPLPLNAFASASVSVPFAVKKGRPTVSSLTFRSNVFPPWSRGREDTADFPFAAAYWTNGRRQHFDGAIYSRNGKEYITGTGAAAVLDVPADVRGDPAAFDWYDLTNKVAGATAAAPGPQQVQARLRYFERQRIRDFALFFQTRCPAGLTHEYADGTRDCRNCGMSINSAAIAFEQGKVTDADRSQLHAAFDKFRETFLAEFLRAPPAAATSKISPPRPPPTPLTYAGLDASPVAAWAKHAGVPAARLMTLGLADGAPPSLAAVHQLDGFTILVHSSWQQLRLSADVAFIAPLTALAAQHTAGTRHNGPVLAALLAAPPPARSALEGLNKLPDLLLHGPYAASRAAAELLPIPLRRDWLLEQLATKMVSLYESTGKVSAAHKKLVATYLTLLTHSILETNDTANARVDLEKVSLRDRSTVEAALQHTAALGPETPDITAPADTAMDTGADEIDEDRAAADDVDQDGTDNGRFGRDD